MTFELFYATGGHGGPYDTYDSAKYRAIDMLRGCRSETAIKIVERTTNGIGGYGNTLGRVYRTVEGIFHTKHNIVEFFGGGD